MPLASNAVDLTAGAATSNAFTTSAGALLPAGSLVRIGTFVVSDTSIQENSSNLTYLNTNFREVFSTTVGTGADGANGYFSTVSNNIDTTASGLNVSGAMLYYWVFNAPSQVSATEQGIFTSSLWEIPSGNGSVLDLSNITTDIGDLTGQSNSLLPSAKIVVGSFGTATYEGFSSFGLAAIPEPSTFAGLMGLAALGFAATRRRRNAA